MISYASKLNGIPSERYRIHLPSKYIDGEIRKAGYNKDADISIFFKHYSQKEYFQALDAVERGQRVIFDMCDNHFETQTQNGAMREHYLRMCDIATQITCPTHYMAMAIKHHTGRDAVVIEDPYEMPEMTPFTLKEHSAMWYGYLTGLNMAALELADIQMPVEWVTKTSGKALDEYMSRNDMSNVTLTEYSHENMLAAFGRNDIVVIPSVNDSRCYTKSHNRLLEGLRAGKIVCAAPLPSYLPFADYCYLDWDINKAIEKATRDPKAIERTRAGQDFIRDKFSPQAIGQKWNQLLN